MSTFRDLVKAVTTNLGEVAGTGVQAYSEDRILEVVVQTFNLVWGKYAWDQYTDWSQRTLDGTLGIITADLSDVRSHEDIINVFPATSDVPLPKMNRSRNPFLLQGTSVRFWSSLPSNSAYYATRRLQFWPKSATGDVVIQHRIYPVNKTGANDPCYLDFDLMTYATSWQMLSGEGTNPAASATQQALFDMKYRDLMNLFAGQPIEAQPGLSYDYRSEWEPS